MADAGAANAWWRQNHPELVDLPRSPGHYIWHVLDPHSVGVGLVQVVADSEEHREYLRRRRAERLEKGEKPGFYVYRNDAGAWLTMYHQANDNIPPCDDDGKPFVDGYRPVNFDWLLGAAGPTSG